MKHAELKRKTPMARGSSTLKTHKPLQAKTPIKASSKPMAAVGARGKRMRQGKVAPTAEEAVWMSKVAAFGCIVCWLRHGARTPGAVHHLISGGRRMGHLFTINLCDPGHHQNSPTPAKISRHPHKKRFEQEYGTELELLAEMQSLLAGDKQ